MDKKYFWKQEKELIFLIDFYICRESSVKLF